MNISEAISKYGITLRGDGRIQSGQKVEGADHAWIGEHKVTNVD